MLFALFITIALTSPAAPTDFDALWQQYHTAGDPVGREITWRELQKAGWPDDFELTIERLRSRAYSTDVPTGELHEVRVARDDQRYKYIVLIPETYDSTRAYPLQVVLHGSARRPAWRDDEQHWRRVEPFRSENMVTVFPAAWEDAMWWSDRQIENLRAILDTLRARYHIDSNRCTLTGLSDGGTGTFYHALRAPTPWAAFLPLIGHPWVLGNELEGADGNIFAANLSGRALMVVNGADDPLYPAAGLVSYLDLFERAGATIEFKVKPGGHNVRWWPEEAAAFRAFREAHPRDPFPDEIVWETGDPRRSGRCGWVVVEDLGESSPPDPDPLNTVLFPDLDPPTRAEAFPRAGVSGRVSVHRIGNQVEVELRNVDRFVLLLGVDEFDFAEPVKVVMDGETVVHFVTPSVETLMKWAVRDGDPEALVGGEIELDRRL